MVLKKFLIVDIWPERKIIFVGDRHGRLVCGLDPNSLNIDPSHHSCGFVLGSIVEVDMDEQCIQEFEQKHMHGNAMFQGFLIDNIRVQCVLKRVLPKEEEEQLEGEEKNRLEFYKKYGCVFIHKQTGQITVSRRFNSKSFGHMGFLIQGYAAGLGQDGKHYMNDGFILSCLKNSLRAMFNNTNITHPNVIREVQLLHELFSHQTVQESHFLPFFGRDKEKFKKERKQMADWLNKNSELRVKMLELVAKELENRKSQNAPTLKQSEFEFPELHPIEDKEPSETSRHRSLKAFWKFVDKSCVSLPISCTSNSNQEPKPVSLLVNHPSHAGEKHCARFKLQLFFCLYDKGLEEKKKQIWRGFKRLEDTPRQTFSPIMRDVLQMANKLLGSVCNENESVISAATQSIPVEPTLHFHERAELRDISVLKVKKTIKNGTRIQQEDGKYLCEHENCSVVVIPEFEEGKMSFIVITAWKSKPLVGKLLVGEKEAALDSLVVCDVAYPSPLIEEKQSAIAERDLLPVEPWNEDVEIDENEDDESGLEQEQAQAELPDSAEQFEEQKEEKK